VELVFRTREPKGYIHEEARRGTLYTIGSTYATQASQRHKCHHKLLIDYTGVWSVPLAKCELVFTKLIFPFKIIFCNLI
jgi:hypothetical protein